MDPTLYVSTKSQPSSWSSAINAWPTQTGEVAAIRCVRLGHIITELFSILFYSFSLLLNWLFLRKYIFYFLSNYMITIWGRMCMCYICVMSCSFRHHAQRRAYRCGCRIRTTCVCMPARCLMWTLGWMSGCTVGSWSALPAQTSAATALFLMNSHQSTRLVLFA